MNGHEPNYPYGPYNPDDEYNPDNPNYVKELLRKLKRRHDMLAEKLEKIMTELEELAYDIQRLEDNPKIFVALLRERQGPARKAPNGHRTNHLNAKRLQRGVQSVRINAGPNGYDMVVIERRPPFLLPKRLAALLEVLAEETSGSPDHIVGWKTRQDIALRLNQREEKHTLPESINQLVHRLRHALEQYGGLDKKLVEVRRNQGVRFRVREMRRGSERF